MNDTTDNFEQLASSPCSAFIKALSANFLRHFDLKLQIAQCKRELELLESQWGDLSDQFKNDDVHQWANFMLSLDDNTLNMNKLHAQWEQANPGWETHRGGVKKRKQSTIKESLTAQAATMPNRS